MQAKEAPHMHVLACICSNVRQFQSALSDKQLIHLLMAWPCFVSRGAGELCACGGVRTCKRSTV